jgi:hypothetical protein
MDEIEGTCRRRQQILELRLVGLERLGRFVETADEPSPDERLHFRAMVISRQEDLVA